MLYLILLVLGIILGLLMKGRISNLKELKFGKVWIILLAFVIQVSAQLAALKGFEFFIIYSLWTQSIVYSLMIMGFWFNRHYFGMLIIGAGCMSNALAVILNNGKMPVSYESLVRINMTEYADLIRKGGDGKHILLSENSKLTFLTDIIVLPKFAGTLMPIVSLGDLLVGAGLFLIVFGVVSGSRMLVKQESNTSHAD